MRDVAGATENQPRTKRYACFAAAAVALFFVLSLSGGNQDAGSDVVGGQAKHHIAQLLKRSEGKVANDGIDEDVEFSSAESKFNRTVNEQISMNENMLSQELDKELVKIDANLEDLLKASGVEFSEDEITSMKVEFRTQTDRDVHKYIHDQADDAMDMAKTELQNDLDRDADDTKVEGKQEVVAQTSELLTVLKDKIDGIAMAAKNQMKSFAAGAEKKIVEQKFEEKTSQSYVATISDEDTVTSVEKKADEEVQTTKKAAKKAPIPPPTQAPKPKNTKKGTKKASEPETEQDEGLDKPDEG